jgi:hypothetical protein
MLISSDGNTVYLKAEFKDEDEIERVVLDNYQQLFGNYSLLLPKAKVMTLGGKGTIPDGIIVNFESKEWFIIEVERGIHGTWSHIAPQISKQITAFSNKETEEKIKELCIQEIAQYPSFKDLIFELEVTEMKIHGYLNSIFLKNPIIAIPIDEIPSDLSEWAQTLKNEVRIWEIGKYTFGNKVLYTFPDEAIPSIITRTKGSISIVDKTKASNYWSSVIDHNLINDGDELHFDYGPKGKKKKHFTGIARKNGVEVNGEIRSPSISSLKCIQSISPSRTSSNGWVVWKTEDGRLITELYHQVEESGEAEEI